MTLATANIGRLSRLFLAMVLAGTLACLYSASPAPAQSDVLQKIKDRAETRRAIVGLIASGDDTGTRIAAFEEAVRGDDAELRLSAMDAALSSQQPRLRKAALRYFLNGRPELRTEFILPDGANKGQQLLYNKHQALRFMKITVDPQTDIITFGRRKNDFWSGQLVDDGFDLTFARPRPYSETLNCIMKMRLAGAKELTGNLDCVIKDETWRRQTGMDHAVIPVRIKLS